MTSPFLTVYGYVLVYVTLAFALLVLWCVALEGLRVVAAAHQRAMARVHKAAQAERAYPTTNVIPLQPTGTHQHVVIPHSRAR